jgi:hypothetical protein
MSEWRVVVEACFAAPFVAVAIRCVGLRRVSAFRPAPRRRPVTCGLAPERAAAIVDAALSRLSAQCLTKALVAHYVLGRRGITTDLVVGAAVNGGRFRAHAWVECEGRILVGAGTDVYAPLWTSL